MKKKQHEHTPDYAIPPGATLAESIAHLGITERELALRAVLPLSAIEEIISGEMKISPEIATKLETATSIPARIWNNLETQYQARKEELAETERRRLGAG